MDDILRAVHLYQNQKFDEASVIFNQCIQNANLSLEEIETCYEYLIKIYEILRLEKERIGIEQKYLKFLDEQQLDIKKIELLKKIIKRKKYINSYANLYELWSLQIKNGKIQQAKETSKIILNYLMVRKNSAALKSYLKEYAVEYGESEEYTSHFLDTLLIEGNYGCIDQLLGEKNQLHGSNLSCKMFETFLKNLALSNELLLGKYKNITNCYVEILLIEQKEGIADNQKEILNYIHDCIGIHGLDEKSITLLFEYIKIFLSGYLFFDADYYHEIIDNSSMLDNYKKDLQNQVNELEKIFSSIKLEVAKDKDDASGFHEFIYKQDLAVRNNEVNKLERDILFLRSIGKTQEAEVKAKLLKKIDENNTIINQSEEIIKSDESNANPMDDLKLILGDIDARTDDGFKNLNLNNNLSEVAFIKYIENMDNKVLIKNIEDISMALFVSGMSQSALFAIKKFLKEVDTAQDIASKINLEYLSTAILFDMEKFQEVIGTVDRVISSYPLKNDEQVDFLYFKAESLMKLGYKNDALQFYRKIETLVKGYRLVNLRLREVE